MTNLAQAYMVDVCGENNEEVTRTVIFKSEPLKFLILFFNNILLAGQHTLIIIIKKKSFQRIQARHTLERNNKI